jgi:hypothetical protein
MYKYTILALIALFLLLTHSSEVESQSLYRRFVGHIHYTNIPYRNTTFHTKNKTFTVQFANPRIERLCKEFSDCGCNLEVYGRVYYPSPGSRLPPVLEIYEIRRISSRR